MGVSLPKSNHGMNELTNFFTNRIMWKNISALIPQCGPMTINKRWKCTTAHNKYFKFWNMAKYIALHIWFYCGSNDYKYMRMSKYFRLGKGLGGKLTGRAVFPRVRRRMTIVRLVLCNGGMRMRRVNFPAHGQQTRFCVSKRQETVFLTHPFGNRQK